MLREIIRPTTKSYNIQIPQEYINTEVEILVLPFSSKKSEKIKEDDYEFWTNEEIENFGKYSLGLSSNDFEDDEDYSKW
jgi:hypothetical protein